MQETPQQYIQRMMGLVESKDPREIYKTTAATLGKLVEGLDREKLTKRPEPEKWSISEVLAHLADGEVVGAWRLRSVLGKNGTTIQSFDQDAWAKTFRYEQQDPKASLETFRVLRASNVALLDSIPAKLWDNYGTHEERGKETVAHIVEMYAGHDLNHLRQVEAMAKAAW